MSACADRNPSAPQHFDLGASFASGEEELLGDPLVGDTVFYDTTTGGLRARYEIIIAGQEHEFYMPAHAFPWGWFTANNPDCSYDEIHDTQGAGVAGTGTETHCLPNGEYTVNFYRATWSPDGASHTKQLLFTRKIAMLNANGAPNDSTGGSTLVNYHDQHVRFDLGSATTSLSGSIQAGTEIHEMLTTSDLYGFTPSFTIAAGDALWLTSTYTASGTDGRPWYNSARGVMTAFYWNYNQDLTAFSGAVNSVPFTPDPTKPYRNAFVHNTDFTFVVRGRILEPYQNGTSQPGTLSSDSIVVHVVAPISCFTHADTLATNTPIQFDGSCSSVYGGPIERFWDFGDGSNSGWTYNVSSSSHSYSAPGTYTVRLDVRRSGVATPVSSTSQVLQVPAVAAGIVGDDIIWTTGSYTWNSTVTGGATPYQYTWYYKKNGTESVVGNGTSYTRTVSTAGAPYVFRLRLVVVDSQSSSANVIFWVDVPGGGGALAANTLGTIDASGSCQALPNSRSGRIARYDAIVRAGGWPALCSVGSRF